MQWSLLKPEGTDFPYRPLTGTITPVAKSGRVSEWSMEMVLKTIEPATVPWVRIPPLPPDNMQAYSNKQLYRIGFQGALQALAPSVILVWLPGAFLSNAAQKPGVGEGAFLIMPLFLTFPVAVLLSYVVGYRYFRLKGVNRPKLLALLATVSTLPIWPGLLLMPFIVAKVANSRAR
jgi:hypothetical protein